MNILLAKVAAGRGHTSTPVRREGMQPVGSCLPSFKTYVSQVNPAKLFSGEAVGSMEAMPIK